MTRACGKVLWLVRNKLINIDSAIGLRVVWKLYNGSFVSDVTQKMRF